MAAAVITVTRPTDVRGCKMGNKKVVFRDITADTGDYAAGGFTLTAAQLGLSKHVDFCMVGSSATEGTDGANAQIIGVTYVSSGTSVKFQVYEAAASGAPPLEKTAEAYPANFIFRVMVVGN
jgi:hypothetical protein